MTRFLPGQKIILDLLKSGCCHRAQWFDIPGSSTELTTERTKKMKITIKPNRQARRASKSKRRRPKTLGSFYKRQKRNRLKLEGFT